MARYGNEPLQRWAAFPGFSKAEAIAKEILWIAPGSTPGSARSD
jgi:hypothetical protein